MVGLDTTARILEDQITIGEGDREPTRMLWRSQRGLAGVRKGREADQADSANSTFGNQGPNSFSGSSIKKCLIYSIAAFALAATGLAGCGKSESAESGETHFLGFCDEDICGDGMTCVCGVCTTACTESSECGGLASGASCETLATSCEGVTNACDFTCDGAEDCAGLGAEYECVSGSCRKGEPPPPAECPAECFELVGNPVDVTAGCADLDSSETVGCTCEQVGPILLPHPMTCRRRVADGAVFWMPDLEPLDASDFEACTAEESAASETPCGFTACEERPTSSCSFEDTCAQIGCGGQQFDENGCQRPICEEDGECLPNEECVHLDATFTSACDMSSGTCQCGGPTIAIPGSFCNPRPPVELGELCDGSDSARLVMGGGGGHVEDTYEFLTPDGEYVVIDGQCRYYLVGSDPSRILSGTLDATDAEALANGVGWPNYSSWSPYLDQQSCPDAGGTYLLAPDVVLTCTCGCDENAPAGLEDAFTQSGAFRTTFESEGVALEGLTLQAVAKLATQLPDPGERPILEWTLDLALDALLIGENDQYAEDSGILVDDAATVAELRKLRDESGAGPEEYVFVEDDSGTRYGVLLRANLPAALAADVTAMRESAFR
jgi:hypothetical protein